MMVHGREFYLCDPEKYATIGKELGGSCTMRACYTKGGPCYLTISKECMKSMNYTLKDFAIEPTRAHPTDAGLDLYSPIDTWLHPGEHKMIDTGVSVEIPDGFVGLITSKSGLMSQGITSRGTIDSHYRGTIKAVLYNHAQEGFKIRRGYKITQLVIVPCLIPELQRVDELSDTDRGDGGFGSTGL